jgi:hypothetical protein
MKRVGDLTVYENGDIFFKGRQLIPRIKVDENHKAMRVNIPIKNGYKSMYVHQLVANLYIENPNNYPNVLHIDGDYTNNHKDNLVWGFPRTKERRTENVHKIAPALDEFDYEGAEYMGRVIYDFLKTGEEWRLRELFKKEEKYFMEVIANEMPYKKSNFYFVAKDIYDFFIDRMISKISRGFFLPKKENWRFVVYCRESLKKDVLFYYKSEPQFVSIYL